ncbi:MAG: hypothetical protein IPM54_36565 [Polyangiaceae bacterium]|nr:hypothetical protein [Polyangiaceae bacterium]
MAEEIATRLRFSNDERSHIAALVRHHVIRYDDTWTDGDVRRWIRRIGVPLMKDLFRLAIADLQGKGVDVSEQVAALERLRERSNQLLAAGAVLSTKDLALRGGDLMRELSVPPGPIVGEVLQALVEVVTDEPADNERERLLGHARRLLSERSAAPS